MSEKLVTIQVRQSVAAELEAEYGRLPRRHPNGSPIKTIFDGERIQGCELILLCTRAMNLVGGANKFDIEELMIEVGYAKDPVASPLSRLKMEGLVIESDGKLFLPPNDTDKGRLARQINSRLELVGKLRSHLLGEE